MAFLAQHPSMVDFLDLMSIVPDLRLEQILVRAGSVLDGTTVAAASAAYRDATILAIGPAEIRRWQTELAANTGHATVQQCRSLLLRIFQYAVDEGVIDINPVRKVSVPKRRADPEKVFGQARRRALTPQEAGQLLARFPCSGGITC
jgi:site-specific recombinase XerD